MKFYYWFIKTQPPKSTIPGYAFKSGLKVYDYSSYNQYLTLRDIRSISLTGGSMYLALNRCDSVFASLELWETNSEGLPPQVSTKQRPKTQKRRLVFCFTGLLNQRQSNQSKLYFRHQLTQNQWGLRFVDKTGSNYKTKTHSKSFWNHLK